MGDLGHTVMYVWYCTVEYLHS